MATNQAQLEFRRGDDRGTTKRGWLHARHSFSFGRYHDPNRMSFRALRVLNDDVFQPGGGFPEHPHEDMEIITWILDGALEHEDNTGQRGVIRPGDVQVMTAGRGIRHSEMNASQSDPVHVIQIWIEPSERELEPSYTQKSMPSEGRRNQWQVVASPDGRGDSLRIGQDATLSVSELEGGEPLGLALGAGRHGYLHVAFGAIRVSDAELREGDAIAFAGQCELNIETIEVCQLLFLDLP